MDRGAAKLVDDAGTGRERRFLVALIICGLVAIALSRSPQWLGDQLFPDGDEGVVALMAKHLAEGREVPIFFCGQSYGLTFFEAAVAAASFRLFGSTDQALKGAMLFLWSVGWCFSVLAAHRWAGRRGALLAAIALIVCPAWAILSMKARGGPVTAFAFTGLLLWLIPSDDAPAAAGAPRRTGRLLLVGACTAMIALAQMLWLLPVLPLLLLSLRARGSVRRDIVPLGYGFLIVYAAVMVMPSPHRSHYWTPGLLSHVAPGHALIHLPKNLFVATSGAYWMDNVLAMGPWTKVAAAAWLAAWIACAAVAIVRRHPRWLVALVLAGALPIVATLGLRTQPYMYRYLAPAVAPLLLAVAIAAAAALAPGHRRRALVAAGLAALVITSALALSEFRRVSASGVEVGPGFTPRTAFGALLARLRAAGVRHVYCSDPMWQWTIMWESGEQIVARWLHPEDRVPDFPAAVDRALFEGRPVAFVGQVAEVGELAAALQAAGRPGAPEIVAGTFTVVVDPGIDVIRRLGFILNEPANLGPAK